MEIQEISHAIYDLKSGEVKRFTAIVCMCVCWISLPSTSARSSLDSVNLKCDKNVTVLIKATLITLYLLIGRYNRGYSSKLRHCMNCIGHKMGSIMILGDRFGIISENIMSVRGTLSFIVNCFLYGLSCHKVCYLFKKMGGCRQ